MFEAEHVTYSVPAQIRHWLVGQIRWGAHAHGSARARSLEQITGGASGILTLRAPTRALDTCVHLPPAAPGMTAVIRLGDILQAAVSKDDLDRVRELLERGAPVNERRAHPQPQLCLLCLLWSDDDGS